MRIGHVHLKVADPERSLSFWRDLIGLEVQQRMGSQAVFLSADGYHHHIALNTWESAGGSPPPFGTTGLFHVALLYPDSRALAAAFKRLAAANWPLEGASDHGVSEALYLRDPDGNGVELYRDRDSADWPRDDAGALAMFTKRLDLRGLLADAG
jgi:catechol 2,3-dioxygenase